MGEVDEPQHAVHERVAQGDQRVDGSQRESVDRLSPELVNQATEAGANGGLLVGPAGRALVATLPPGYPVTPANETSRNYALVSQGIDGLEATGR